MNNVEFRRKVIGCWLGKAVGGTLGQPYEGTEGPLSLSFYDPVPTDMIPNDDLDLQVLWACVMDKMDKPRVDRQVFADAWLEHVNFPWDEYGLAIRNIRNGIRPPYSGSYDNFFVRGLGAAIRSELWACLAPGNPQLAADYAYEDACVDHDGEGMYAEIFFAALESQAFVESSIPELIKAGLSAIPADSRLSKAIQDTCTWWHHLKNWTAVRERILAAYGSDNFTDVIMNIPFTILGLLAGNGDFSQTICIAANCGQDVDCTAASAGAMRAPRRATTPLPPRRSRSAGTATPMRPTRTAMPLIPTAKPNSMPRHSACALNGFTTPLAPCGSAVQAGWSL